MAADPRVTIIKILDRFEEYETERREQIDAMLAEFRDLLNGGEGTGPKVTWLKDYYIEAWTIRYKEPYLFTNHAMVGASLKRLLKTHGKEQIAAKIMAYIKDSDPFYVKVRHSFEVFVKVFNQIVVTAEQPTTQASARRAEEMRG